MHSVHICKACTDMHKHGQGATYPCNANLHLPTQSGDIGRKKGVEDTWCDKTDVSYHVLLLHAIGPTRQALPNEQLETVDVTFAYEPFTAVFSYSASNPTMTMTHTSQIKMMSHLKLCVHMCMGPDQFSCSAGVAIASCPMKSCHTVMVNSVHISASFQQICHHLCVTIACCQM